MADITKSAAAEYAAERKPVKRVKKKSRGIASFLILFFILAALVCIIVFNLFNLRDRYIYPFLSRIPLIGGFIPISANNPEELNAMTPDQMTARINELEFQLSQAQDELEAAKDTIVNNRMEIDRLKTFESQQLQFKHDKAAFDQQVAMGDPEAYANYYQSIYPENAETLYPKAAGEASVNAGVKKYLSDIKAMDEVSAANMLRLMIGADMDLVVTIMRGLDSRIAGNILSEMDSQTAASIIKMMAPYNAAPVISPVISPAVPPDQVVNELTDLPEIP